MVHTRATNQEPLQYDPDLELTLFRLRKEFRENFRVLPLFLASEVDSMAAPEHRTLKELTAQTWINSPCALHFRLLIRALHLS